MVGQTGATARRTCPDNGQMPSLDTFYECRGAFAFPVPCADALVLQPPPPTLLHLFYFHPLIGTMHV